MDVDFTPEQMMTLGERMRNANQTIPTWMAGREDIRRRDCDD